MISRRNALTVLGLASTGSSAIAAEGFLKNDLRTPPGKIKALSTGRQASKETIAKALRALADEIESDGVRVSSLNVTTDIKRDELVVQRLAVDFLIHLEG